MSHVQSYPQPWYRQFWPWVLIGLPGATVIASLFTMWFAYSTPNALVVPSGDSVEVATRRSFAAEDRARALGITASLTIDRGDGTIRVRLSEDAGEPSTLTATLSHPAYAERDRQAVLARVGAGLYRGTLDADIQGRWYVTVQPEDADWRLSGELGTGVDRLELEPRRIVQP